MNKKLVNVENMKEELYALGDHFKKRDLSSMETALVVTEFEKITTCIKIKDKIIECLEKEKHRKMLMKVMARGVIDKIALPEEIKNLFDMVVTKVKEAEARTKPKRKARPRRKPVVKKTTEEKTKPVVKKKRR